VTAKHRPNRNISNRQHHQHHHHHHHQRPSTTAMPEGQHRYYNFLSAVANKQTLRAWQAHLLHTRQAQLIAQHIAHQNRGLRQHPRRRLLPRKAHCLRLQGPSLIPRPLSPDPIYSFMFLADAVGATGNQRKQDPSYLGKGDQKSWKQRCCASKVQE